MVEESKEVKLELSSTTAPEAPTSSSEGAQDSLQVPTVTGETVPTVASVTVPTDVAAFLLWAFNETNLNRHAEWMQQAEIDCF